MTASDEETTTPPLAISARERARESAARGDHQGAQMWALISIADDLAAIRRDSDWRRRHPNPVTRG
jgi:hypothetical protein